MISSMVKLSLALIFAFNNLFAVQNTPASYDIFLYLNYLTI